MDPIQALIETSGETAVLKTPATVADYDPSSTDDYSPNADGGPVTLRGVPETKLAYSVGAKAAFTFSCTSLPAGLRSRDSKLTWLGIDWTVIDFRPRHWMGALNGCTLFLEA